MRWSPIGCLVMALMLSGCGRKQPTFDERYDNARQKLEASAKMIDRDILASGSSSEAAEAPTDDAQSAAPVRR
ncbi:MAG: hypothetical protein ABIW31_08040 [Novosphingobium sp.]